VTNGLYPGQNGPNGQQINEMATDAAGSAYLLKFDSVHGTWDEDCEAEGDAMIVGGQHIPCSRNTAIGGTILSGLVYQTQGLTGCLWWSAAFVLAAAMLSFKLPAVEPQAESGVQADNV